MTTSPTPFFGAVLLVLSAGSVLAAPDLEAGRMIFTEAAQPPCAVCHALNDAGSEAEIGPNLDEFKPTVEQVRAAVTSGIGVMPAFADSLTEAQIDTVAEYVAQVTGGDETAAAEPASSEDAPPIEGGAEVQMPGADILAVGDPAKGEKGFRKCAACHTVEKGAPNRVGPNLFGIVGAPVASVEGYDYSDALGEYGGDWTPDRLAAFLAEPRAAVPGTKMSFAGLRKEQDRADVLAYLDGLAE